jgi:hypothetical protein
MAGPLVVVLAVAWSGAAAAAAPRDAIRQLPQITHTSEFDINSTGPAGTYQDQYVDYWRFDWSLPEVRLPGASLRTTLNYNTTLLDNLDRLNHSSSDSRSDTVNFRLDLNTPGGLSGYYFMNQADVVSGRTPSASPPSWQSSQTKEMQLRWSMPRLPAVYARHNVFTNNYYVGQTQASASEVMTTTVGGSYNADAGGAPQSYSVETDLIQNEVYLPQRSSSSQRRTYYSGVRSMALGGVGNLTLDYNYDERTARGPGQIEPLTNSQGSYGLSLYGGVQGLPLQYSYNYRSLFDSYQTQPGDQTNTSDLNLTLTPAMPAGRSAVFNFHYLLSDYDSQSVHTTQNSQSATWSFAANPHVNGTINYQLDNTNNELAHQQSNDNEQVALNMNYRLPKNRGDLAGTYTQQVQRTPGTGGVVTYNQWNATAGFNLDRRTRLGLLYSLQANDNRVGPFEPPRSTTTTSSGVTYSFSSGTGLSMNATWQTILQETQPSAALSNTDRLNLTLNYDTPVGWRYQLSLASNDYDRRSFSGDGNSYSTEDHIQAIVSYTF